MHTSEPLNFLGRLVQSTLLCGACALPSFLLALMAGGFDPLWMGCGVAGFILFYATMADTEGFARFMEKPFVRRTFKIGFATRFTLTVLFPLGFGIDIMTGIASTTAVGMLGIRSETPPGTLLTTLVQGALLSGELALYMLLVYGLLRAYGAREPRDPNICARCGYDIRASREFGRCPECGAAC